MTPQVFAGFMDGINDSLKESVDVETLEETTELALDVDYEKLFLICWRLRPSGFPLCRNGMAY